MLSHFFRSSIIVAMGFFLKLWLFLQLSWLGFVITTCLYPHFLFSYPCFKILMDFELFCTLPVRAILYQMCRTSCGSQTQFPLNYRPLELYSPIFHRLGSNAGIRIPIEFPYKSKCNGFLFVLLPFRDRSTK